MLDVRGIVKRFGGTVALDGLSLSVARGAIVGFLGPNGAGKSTTMRAVMGLISIDDGEIRWDGAPIDGAVRRRFGYMPAERGMYPKMTVRDEIVHFARIAGLTKAQALTATDEWMSRLGVDGRADDEVQALSSGNQQRVQLAMALVHGPELLILDEPFSGLDPVAVETMKDVLAEQVAAGTSVLFSSHQLDLVSDVSRDVVIIDAGRVVLHGDVLDIRRRAASREAVVAFAEPTSWDVAGVLEREAGRRYRVRVPSSVSPRDLLEAASGSGTVIEFSFAPPDLSEVFLDAVGGRPRPGDASDVAP